jgi:uncharacterized Ntn-hydrolase superfamily protein
MTFSVVARDAANGDLGIAVASKFPAVGAVVPWARAGVGAVATQSWANTDFGPWGLVLMGGGLDAESVLGRLLDADAGAESRQVGLVDVSGNAATFTCERCLPWCGGVVGDGFACQGNILVGESVVTQMAGAFAQTEGDLCDRLLAALEAGDAAGGDRRGRQSAALLVVRDGGGYEGRNDRYIDLRVDDHPAAVTELRRVFGEFDETMLVRTDPLLEATPALVSEIQRRLAALGHYGGPETGLMDDATRGALVDWVAELNLEGRLHEDGMLSSLVVRELRDVTPEVGDS